MPALPSLQLNASGSGSPRSGIKIAGTIKHHPRTVHRTDINSGFVSAEIELAPTDAAVFVEEVSTTGWPQVAAMVGERKCPTPGPIGAGPGEVRKYARGLDLINHSRRLAIGTAQLFSVRPFTQAVRVVGPSSAVSPGQILIADQVHSKKIGFNRPVPLIGRAIQHILFIAPVGGLARAVRVEIGGIKVGVETQRHPGEAGGAVTGRIVHETVLAIPSVHYHSHAPLLEIAGAVDANGFFFRFAQGRQKQRGEDSNDSDNDEQLDQRKRPPRTMVTRQGTARRSRFEYHHTPLDGISMARIPRSVTRNLADSD